MQVGQKDNSYLRKRIQDTRLGDPPGFENIKQSGWEIATGTSRDDRRIKGNNPATNHTSGVTFWVRIVAG